MTTQIGIYYNDNILHSRRVYCVQYRRLRLLQQTMDSILTVRSTIFKMIYVVIIQGVKNSEQNNKMGRQPNKKARTEKRD